MKRELLDVLLAAREARRPVAIATRLADGAQCLVGDVAPVGTLVLTPEQQSEAAALLAAGTSAPLTSDGGIFVRSHVPSPRLVIVGAVHIAQALAPMARIAGFEVAVIDPRGAFASPERFPGVDLVREWPDAALARLGLDVGTALVALSHDPKLDDPALHLALPSPVFYIGALGSRRTHEKRVARLTEAGFAAHVGRIHSPIGLDLGGRAPAEIAVAILAEVIRIRHGAGA